MAIVSVVGRWLLVVRCSGRIDRSVVLANDQGPTTNDALQLFYRHLVIGIDAHLAGNLHCFFANLAGCKLRMLGKGLGRGFGERASAANGGNATVRLDHVALAAE